MTDIDLDGEEWITVGQAARLASVDPRTVRRWANTGEVRARVTPKGTRQIARSSLVSGYERATAAKADQAAVRGESGPDPAGAVNADPFQAIVGLQGVSANWKYWHPPARTSRRKLERLALASAELEDAIADIRQTVVDELADRDADEAD